MFKKLMNKISDAIITSPLGMMFMLPMMSDDPYAGMSEEEIKKSEADTQKYFEDHASKPTEEPVAKDDNNPSGPIDFNKDIYKK